MKSDTVYKLAFNQALDLVALSEVGDRLPSETELSTTLSVSRTTVRKVLASLTERGQELIRHYRAIERKALSATSRHLKALQAISRHARRA